MAKDNDKKKNKNGPEHDDTARDEPVIRDKRRIDPETGDVREGSPAEADPIDEELKQLIDESADGADAAPTEGAASVPLVELQRLQAEFVNYRKRVERDRSLARELAIADVISELLPVLDDLERADEHGDLEEGSPLALVVQKLHTTLQRIGLEALKPQGEQFDP